MLLPGIREVRAPLIAGYLWLLGLWIVFEPIVGDDVENSELSKTLDRLDGLMSPIALGIVISVAAYLIGALVDGGLQALRLRLVRNRTIGGTAGPDDGPSVKAMWSLEQLGEQHVEQAAQRLAKADLELADLPEGLFGDAEEHMVDEDDRTADRLSGELQRSIMEELPLVATRLMSESPELSSAADRLRAEAELRFAVGLSLPILLAAAAFRLSPWCLFGLLVTPPLLSQAHRRSQAANDVLVDALFLRKVEAPAVERLSRAVDDRITLASAGRSRVRFAEPSL